jgi:hypothetical protein
MRARARIVVLVAVCGSWLLVFSPQAASAHQVKQVGPFTLAVGFGNEPAYSGQPNSVQLLLSEKGKPVTDLGSTLKVEVKFGGSTKGLLIEPNFEVGEFGTPGDYRAWFIPTQIGTYAFHFTGKIGSNPVDLTFTSGPKTFSDVLDPAEAEFPPTNAPTNQELAARLDREGPRLAAVASAASSAAHSARTVGIVGIVVGAVGLIVAVAALASRKRT